MARCSAAPAFGGSSSRAISASGIIGWPRAPCGAQSPNGSVWFRLVLLEGLDASVLRTATVVPEFWRPPGGGAAAGEEDLCIFAPIQHDAESVLKVAVEPLNPQDLHRLLAWEPQVSHR